MVGAGAVQLGARVRILGCSARSAAQLAANGRRGQAAGRPAPSLDRPDRVVPRHRGGVDRTGDVANDDYGLIQLLPPLCSRRLPTRPRRPHPGRAANRGATMTSARFRLAVGGLALIAAAALTSACSAVTSGSTPGQAGLAGQAAGGGSTPAPGQPQTSSAPTALSASELAHPDGKFFGIEAQGAPDSLGPADDVAAAV